MTVSPDFIERVFKQRHNYTQALDNIKKAIFYNRVPKAEYQIPANAFGKEHKYETEQERYAFHAIVGLDTEVGELIELLADKEKLTREKLLDECGDVMWYLALLLDKYNIQFEEVMDKNVQKLEARYPKGFSTSAAIHRDEAKENAIFT